VTRVSGGVLQGKASRRPAPSYPQSAKEQGIQGIVVVEVTVSEAGEVLSARVVQGTGSALDSAALAAAIKWEFLPTTLGGVPVKVIGSITFNFKKF
jgi:TonB family protein